MSGLINCKFCIQICWDRQSQSPYCKERHVYISDTDWSANHCAMFKIDERFTTTFELPKMSAFIKCIDCEFFPRGKELKENVYCKKRSFHIFKPRAGRVCRTYIQRKTEITGNNYAQIRWNVHNGGNLHEYSARSTENVTVHNKKSVANQINGHIGKFTFEELRDSPFGVVSYPAEKSMSRVDRAHVQGSKVEGEIKMNENMEKRVKERQENINKIVDIRKEYVKAWLKKFKELDSDIRYKYILKYSWLRSDFRKYILNNVGKKTKKGLNTCLKNILLQMNDGSILYGKSGKRIQAHLLSGEKWNFVKKLLAIINKYASAYANDKLKIKYSDLTSKYDVLLYDDETLICEACGTENQIIATFCNNCGKKL